MRPPNHLILCCSLCSCPQSLPASWSFPMNQLFASGGQSIGVSGSASVLPMNIQDWFPLIPSSTIFHVNSGILPLFSMGHNFLQASKVLPIRMALKHVKYHVWNELPVQVQCTILDAWGWCTGTTQRDGMGREEGGGFRMGNTCIPVADSFWYLAKLIQLCKV